MPTKFPKENFGIIVNIYIRPVFSNVLYQNIVSNEYGSKCKFIMSLAKGSLSNTQKNRKTRNLQIFITNYNASITYNFNTSLKIKNTWKTKNNSQSSRHFFSSKRTEDSVKESPWPPLEIHNLTWQNKKRVCYHVHVFGCRDFKKRTPHFIG